MAKIEITVPGERIVEDFTALVPQPTSPSTARAPDVGLVELSYVNPTDLIPGPPGPPGPAGSRWYTGVGDPGALPGQLGDMYLDDVTGKIWTYNGVAWVDTGTDLSPDAIELLNKIKTVDGSGSGLDADTLDGFHGPYYLDWNNQTNKPSTFPPTLPIAESDVTNLVADLALKAPLASPTFTGDPKAPTPAAADNDTSIATTAFVKSVVGTVNPFPEAPIDGLTYGRKDAAWATVVGGAVISDTAPAGPLQAGQLWYESDSGNTYIWYDDPSADAGQWVMVNVLPDQGPPPPPDPPGFVRQQFLTTSGAIILHADTTYFQVEVQGGGGSGGPSNSTGATTAGCGGGGGAGGYGSKIILRPAGAYSPTCTIAAASAVNGNGNSSSFSDGTSTLTASGGLAGGTGVPSNNSYAVLGGLGGDATGGTINQRGAAGGYGLELGTAVQNSINTGIGGQGASSRFGAGGNANFTSLGAAATAGAQPPYGYGSGGGGSVSIGGGAAQQGAAGAQGCVVVTEYR